MKPSVAVQPGLCLTYLETLKKGFLTSRLMMKDSTYKSIDNICHGNITHRNDIDDESQFLVW